MKGVTTCNRTACQVELAEGAIYYNSATKANYCPYCAYLINTNSGLCQLLPPKRFDLPELNKHRKVLKDLDSKIKNMYPKDGLISPRDIKLASEINRLAIYIDDVKNNTKIKDM